MSCKRCQMLKSTVSIALSDIADGKRKLNRAQKRNPENESRYALELEHRQARLDRATADLEEHQADCEDVIPDDATTSSAGHREALTEEQAQQIRELQLAGRSQNQIAEELGINRSTVQAYTTRRDGLKLFAFDEQPWSIDALCAQTDPDAFFPDKGGSTREAKAVCGRCPVRAECLEYALEHQERFGIWGGLSERERRKIKKKDPAA